MNATLPFFARAFAGFWGCFFLYVLLTYLPFQVAAVLQWGFLLCTRETLPALIIPVLYAVFKHNFLRNLPLIPCGKFQVAWVKLQHL